MDRVIKSIVSRCSGVSVGSLRKDRFSSERRISSSCSCSDTMVGAMSLARSRAMVASTSCCTISSAARPFALPLAHVAVYDALQIVDVVEENVVYFVDRRVQVAWDADVDQENGAVAARADDALHRLRVNDVVCRRDRSDHDVDFGKHRLKALVFDRSAAEKFGQILRVRSRPIGYVDVRRAAPPQVSRGQLRHLTAADDHHLASGERSEDLARQFDRRIAHGDGHLTDARFRAHAFRDMERVAHDQVQQTPAARALLFRRLVRGFELPKDLRLPDDHRA